VRRNRRSLLLSLLAIGLTGPLLLAVAVSLRQSIVQTTLLRQAAEQHLKALAETAAGSGLRDAGQPDSAGKLADEAGRLAELTGTRVMLLEATEDSRVLADSHPEESAGDLSSAMDLYLARRFGDGTFTTESAGFSMSWAAIRMTGTGSNRILRLGLPTYALAGSPAESASSQKPIPVSAPGSLLHSALFWVLTALICLLVSILAAQLARRIRQPLSNLTDALRRLPDVSSQYAPQISTQGQFEELADAFNEAVEALNLEFQKQRARTAEMEENARFLETVLSSMIEGVVVVDSVHRIVYANTAAAMLLGYSQRMIGRQLLEVVRHQSIDQALRQALSEQERARCELELSRVRRTVSVLTSRLPGDPPSGAVLVIHDITELRRLETMRRDFVSSASHELKTPLAGIQAYVDSLLNGAMEDEETCRRFLMRIAEQSERLNSLIQDLLQLARIESGRESFNIMRLNVHEAIQEVLENQQPIAGSHELTLTFEPGPRDLHALADARGLRTILENLIGNAIKYTPAGGRITVRWGTAGTQVRIDVIDTGVGIPKDHLSRIFERFYRVDEARSRDAGGTGLGLSIVKHLTQVLGGRVTVESQVGRGSTFTVFLPLAGPAS